MHKSSLRWWWAALIIFVTLGLAGCEQRFSPPTSTSTPASEPTAIATALPTATPVIPEGPYPPVLRGYEPRAGQEVAAATATIKLYFDQPMAPASVVAALRITPPLEGAVEWPDDATLVFRPHALAPATRYRVTLAGDVRSAAGLPLSTELSFAFSTLAPLAVTRVTPSSGALDARIDAPALIVFNRPIVPLACVGQPASAGGECPALSLTFTPAVLGTGMWVETSVYRFDALRGWAAGRMYTATLAADVESLEGAALREPVTWSFSTALPTLQASVPPAGQLQTPLETDIRVIFNTPMDQEITGSVFSVSGEGGAVVPGAITWEDNGAVLVFTPLTRLNLGTRYTVQVGARARAATSAPLENPHSWTFTTTPYPTFLAATPPDGATGVDVAAPARLAFAGALDAATLDPHITLTPTAENLYTYFDAAANVYQLAWDKQPQTKYCVLLQPGITDVYGNVIAESHTSCFVTGDLPAFVRPVGGGNAVTLDAAQPSELFFWVRNVNRVAFTLSEVSEPDFVRGRDAAGVVIREWRETFTAPRNTATVAPLVLRRLGGALPAGYYQLAWENPPWGTQALNFAVVDRSLTLKLAAEEALVWVTDLRSGEPISRTAVRLVDREGLLLAAGTTDWDGLARIPISPRENLWENVAAVVGEPGAAGFGVALTSWTGAAAPSAFGIALDGSAAAPFAIQVYTDRAVYGPGETVRFRGMVQEETAHYLASLPDASVQVMLREATGRGVYTSTVALSDMGAFTGALALTESMGVGDYVLEASWPGVSDNRLGTTAFVVAAPRESVLTVSVTPEATDVLRGDPVHTVVTVDDIFGLPVAGAPLTWAVYAQSEPLASVSSVAGPWPGAVSEAGGVTPLLLAAGEAVADEAGRFVLELAPELGALTAVQPFGPQRWIIEAVVCADGPRDACALPVAGQGQVMVHPAYFYVGMQPRGWVVYAGMRTEINLLAQNWTQQPVAAQELAVSLAQRVWFRVPGGSPTWGYTDTVVSTVRVTTNAEGQAVATLVPPRSGTYIVTVDALDADDHPVHHEIMLWASGAEAASWPLEPGKVTPIADARVYNVGDRAKILLPTPFDGPYQMLMTVERDGIREVKRQTLDTPNPIVEIPMVEAYVPNVYVSFVLIRGVTETVGAPEVRSGYVTLQVAPAAQTLTVAALPDQPTYRPGDTVTLTVRVADAVGRPVDAAVSMALVDKASLARAGREPARILPSIIEAFYAMRPLQVLTGGGLPVLSRRQDALALAEESAYRLAHFAEAEAPSRAPGARFADTVLWVDDRRTNITGETELTFVLPDTPATWVAAVYALTAEMRVGETQVEIVAAQPLRVQPVTPRFLVVGDRVEVAAVVSNATDAPLAGAVQLATDAGARVDSPAQAFNLPAGGRARVAWTFSVAQSSVETLALTFSATGGAYRDEVTVELPLYRYVLPDAIGTAGVLDGAGMRFETAAIPPEAGDASALIVRVASSLAGALVDTLTYLDQYPYASTDVLIERSVSYVATYRALQALGVADEALLARLRTAIVQALEQLSARQNVAGGWDWWAGQSMRESFARESFARESFARESFALRLTAFATLGLLEAERAGFDVRQTTRERALGYIHNTLALTLAGEARYPHQALGLYVLSEARVPWPTGAGAALYAARESLGVVGRAYLALALGTSDPADSRLAALLDGLRNDARLSTAGVHWEDDGDSVAGDGGNLHWNTDVVVTGIGVDALARFAPDDPLVTQATRWLMVTRRGGRWQTTYETAWAIVGLSRALRVSGDLASARADVGYDWSVALNGVGLTESTAQPGAGSHLVVAPWRLRAGLTPVESRAAGPLPILFRDRPNLLAISRGSGAGLLYYTAHLELSMPVAQIAPESRGLMVRRDYCAVEEGVAANGAAAPAACRPLTELRVGEQAAVRLTLIAPQSHAYVRLEAPYPAGFVPVSMTTGALPDCALAQSGWGAAPFERCEALNDRIVFFASEAAAGTYQLTYVLRAVTPGIYGALPAVVSEIYFPEVWGRSAGDVLRIVP